MAMRRLLPMTASLLRRNRLLAHDGSSRCRSGLELGRRDCAVRLSRVHAHFSWNSVDSTSICTARNFVCTWRLRQRHPYASGCGNNQRNNVDWPCRRGCLNGHCDNNLGVGAPFELSGLSCGTKSCWICNSRKSYSLCFINPCFCGPSIGHHKPRTCFC